MICAHFLLPGSIRLREQECIEESERVRCKKCASFIYSHFRQSPRYSVEFTRHSARATDPRETRERSSSRSKQKQRPPYAKFIDLSKIQAWVGGESAFLCFLLICRRLAFYSLAIVTAGKKISPGNEDAQWKGCMSRFCTIELMVVGVLIDEHQFRIIRRVNTEGRKI
jgi:hypothetical protein